MFPALRLFVVDQRGAAAAEMALILPLLLALLFTGLEGAHYLYAEHQVVKGVRDGARYAGRLPFTSFTCGSLVNSSDITAVQNVTRTGLPTGGNARVRGWVNTHVTVGASCTALDTGIYQDMTNAPRVEVSATVPYISLFGMLTGFDVDVSLHAAQQAAVMGI
ncbi:MAG: TadE/TadG family type IV pilus assembly protein [Novosphingobium sp.]